MHPGVVRAQLAQADQAQRVLGVVAVLAAQPLELAEDLRGVEPDPPVVEADLVGEHVLVEVLAQDDAVRLGAELPQVQPAAAQAEAVTVGAEAQQQVDQPPRREPQAEPADQSSGAGAEGTMPIRLEISSMISHSWRASPDGSTTGSVIWMNGVVCRSRNGSGKSSRSRKVVAGST